MTWYEEAAALTPSMIARQMDEVERNYGHAPYMFIGTVDQCVLYGRLAYGWSDEQCNLFRYHHDVRYHAFVQWVGQLCWLVGRLRERVNEAT